MIGDDSVQAELLAAHLHLIDVLEGAAANATERLTAMRAKLGDKSAL